jgi:hypothetical protein
MRTTITLADDVAAAVDERMRGNHVGRSQAVNDLVRAGLRQTKTRSRYELPTFDLGIKVDITNIGDVLDMLDQCDAEDARSSAG